MVCSGEQKRRFGAHPQESATQDQLDSAREKAHRARFLVLAIARLAGSDTQVGEKQPADAGHDVPNETRIGDAERLVSFGCAIQNILLSAHGAGFGTGLTSGQAMTPPRLRNLFGPSENEQAVCCINAAAGWRFRDVGQG